MAAFGKTVPFEEDKPPKKILFLGDEKVGKTTFIKKYCEHMRDYYRCDSYQGVFLAFTQFLLYRDISDRRIVLRFLDLPAGTTPDSRRDQYPAEVDLVVLCFSIDNPASLENVWQLWFSEFREYYPDSTRFYLLGLKNDMRLELLAKDMIPVTAERANQIHRRFEFSGDYLECSVEGNPQQARHCMDVLICDTIIHEPSN